MKDYTGFFVIATVLFINLNSCDVDGSSALRLLFVY